MRGLQHGQFGCQPGGVRGGAWGRRDQEVLRQPEGDHPRVRDLRVRIHGLGRILMILGSEGPVAGVLRK